MKVPLGEAGPDHCHCFTLQAVPVKWMCWDLSEYIRTSFLPGYNNLLIKSWANVPGSESGLCCAKNRESVPELGTFSHPVHSKTHWLQLQKTLSPAKCGTVELSSGALRRHCFPNAEVVPRGLSPCHPRDVQPSRRHQDKVCRFRCQLLCIKESSEENSVCSLFSGKRTFPALLLS